MNNLEANLAVLRKLEAFARKYPNIRFGQMLVNLDLLRRTVVNGELYVQDPYNEDSIDLLRRLEFSLLELSV
jgi:hypothetical protein